MTPKAPTKPGEYKLCIKAQNGHGLLTSDEYTYYILGDNYGGIYRCREFNVSIDNIDEIIPYICNETDNRYHP